MSRGWSAEREAVDLGAGVEELDLAAALVDAAGLTDELVGALGADRGGAVRVQIGAVRRADRLAVERHPDPVRGFLADRPHDEVQVACLELEGDPGARL